MDWTKLAMDKIYLSWEQIHQDTIELGNRLLALHKQWTTLVAVTRGGLVPAGILSQMLDIKHIETINISSYSDEIMGKTQAHIIKAFKDQSQEILVIDDLIETGFTLEAVTSMLPLAHIACVYSKTTQNSLLHTPAKPMPANAWIVFPWEVNG